MGSQGVANPSQDTQGASAARTATGRYTITFDVAQDSATYTALVTVEEAQTTNDDIQIYINPGSRSTTGFEVLITEQDNGGSAGVFRDRNFNFIVVCPGSSNSTTPSTLPTRAMVVASGFGNNQALAASTDGFTFAPLGNGLITSGWSLAYSPQLERWVCVGEGVNEVIYSDDGFQWLASTSGNSIAAGNAMYAVEWSSTLGIFLAGGENQVGMWSPDGITWASVTIPVANDVLTIAYSPAVSRWVACGNGSPLRCAYSTSGTSGWTASSSTATCNPVEGVQWGGSLNLFLATGGDDTGAPSVMSSADGITWTSLGNPIFTGGTDDGYGVAYYGGLFVLTGRANSGFIERSTDGSTFTSSGNGPFTNRARQAAYHPTLDVWYIAGRGGASLAYSSDAAVTWSQLSSDDVIFDRGYDVECALTAAQSQTREQGALELYDAHKRVARFRQSRAKSNFLNKFRRT